MLDIILDTTFNLIFSILILPYSIAAFFLKAGFSFITSITYFLFQSYIDKLYEKFKSQLDFLYNCLTCLNNFTMDVSSAIRKNIVKFTLKFMLALVIGFSLSLFIYRILEYPLHVRKEVFLSSKDGVLTDSVSLYSYNEPALKQGKFEIFLLINLPANESNNHLGNFDIELSHGLDSGKELIYTRTTHISRNATLVETACEFILFPFRLLGFFKEHMLEVRFPKLKVKSLNPVVRTVVTIKNKDLKVKDVFLEFRPKTTILDCLIWWTKVLLPGSVVFLTIAYYDMVLFVVNKVKTD